MTPRICFDNASFESIEWCFVVVMFYAFSIWLRVVVSLNAIKKERRCRQKRKFLSLNSHALLQGENSGFTQFAVKKERSLRLSMEQKFVPCILGEKI